MNEKFVKNEELVLVQFFCQKKELVLNFVHLWKKELVLVHVRQFVPSLFITVDKNYFRYQSTSNNHNNPSIWTSYYSFSIVNNVCWFRFQNSDQFFSAMQISSLPKYHKKKNLIWTNFYPKFAFSSSFLEKWTSSHSSSPKKN